MITGKTIVTLFKSHLKGNYTERKAILEEQAKRYQNIMSRAKGWYMSDVVSVDGYFSEYGKRYGLMRTFHNEGIC